MRSFIYRLRALGMIALLSVLSVPISAQVIGYSSEGENVIELLLTQSGEYLPQGQRWPFPGVGSIVALERDADGIFYGAAGGPLLRLVRLNPETETWEELQALGVFESIDLAFDDSGLLWISTGTGEIYTYEPETGAYGSATILDTTRELVGLAWSGGRLYALLSSTGPSESYQLGSVEPTTGVVSDSIDLLGLASPELFLRTVQGMDFDVAGGLWVGYLDFQGVITLPSVIGGIVHYADPWADPVGQDRRLEGTFRGTMPIVTTNLEVVAVPTISPVGLLFLILMMAFSATVLLRRRASEAF